MWEPTEDSYRTFIAEVGPRLRHAYIARYGPDVGSEVTADVFAYGWENWKRVTSKQNPAGWLYRVGLSLSRKYFRRPTRLPAVVNPRIPEVEPGLPRQMERLTEKQRIAVLMVHAWGYTVRVSRSAMTDPNRSK